MKKRTHLALAPALILALASLPTLGVAGDTTPGISLELSSAEDQDGSCRLSFVVQNGFAQNLDGLVYETVLFGDTGQVAQLTLLDFESVPAGRMRVRQFQFDGMACSTISRVLINGAERCLGEGLAPSACDAGLTLTTRTKTELVG